MYLDLNQSAVEKHWAMASPRFRKVISIMESTEYWTLDSAQSVEMSMESLSEKMNDATEETLKDKEISNKLIFLLAYCSTGRALRVINWLDEKHSISLHYVNNMRRMGEWKPAQVMLDRLKVIKKISLMAKVFSPHRSRIINKMLD